MIKEKKIVNKSGKGAWVEVTEIEIGQNKPKKEYVINSENSSKVEGFSEFILI